MKPLPNQELFERTVRQCSSWWNSPKSARLVWTQQNGKLNEDFQHMLGVRSLDLDTGYSKRFIDAIAEISQGLDSRALATEVYFIQSPFPDAYTVGSAIVMTSNLLISNVLVPVLAHQLGRIQTGDGIQLLALWHLGFNPTIHTEPEEENFVWPKWLAGASTAHLQFTPLGREWATVWCKQILAADDFVKELGLGRELAQYLKEWHEYKPVGLDKPLPLERIDRLVA